MNRERLPSEVISNRREIEVEMLSPCHGRAEAVIKRVSNHEANSDQSHQCPSPKLLGMFAKDDRFCHIVVLILSFSSNFGPIFGSAYKVQDSSEDISDDNSDHSKYFGNTPFIFPDYFSKSEEKFPFSDEFGSSEPSESRNASRYVSPDEPYSSYEGPKSWESGGPYSFNGVEEQRSAKKPILTLYDDWSPEQDEERSKPSNGHNYSEQSEDGGSEESGTLGGGGGGRVTGPNSQLNRYPPPKTNRPGPPYKTQFFKPQPHSYKQPYTPLQPTPYKPPPPKVYNPPTNQYRSKPIPRPPPKNFHSNPYNRSPNQKPVLKQHYKPIRPAPSPSYSPSFRSSPPSESFPAFRSAPSPSFGPSSQQKIQNGASIHQHQFGVNHDYVPRRKNEEVGLGTSQFPSVSSKPAPKVITKPPQNTFFHLGNPWKDFKPSLPDVFRNQFSAPKKANDFSTDFSTLVLKKAPPNKNSCVKTSKTQQVGSKQPVKWMSCYTCVDEKTGRNYEQCSEDKLQNGKKQNSTSTTTTTKKPVLVRGKRNVPEPREAQINPEPRGKQKNHRDIRGKRQYEYNDNEDEHHYGPDHHEYRFGPEHFVDEDAPVDDHRENSGEAPRETETCWKKKKGEMLCIVCENTANGGTYEQCAYGSDPKKNSYERSVSKVYGTPRLPNNREKYKSSNFRSAAPQKPTARQPRYQNRVQQPRKRYNNGNKQERPQPYNKPRYAGKSRSVTPEQYPEYKVNNHRDVNRPRISVNPYPPLKSRNNNVYGVPDPYNPDVGKAYEQVEPVNYPSIGEHRKSSYNDGMIPYEQSYSDTFSEVFPELNSSPIVPAPVDYGEYDEYDEGDYVEGGEVADGQGQFSVNHKKLDNPSAEQFKQENGEEYINKAIGDFSKKNRTSCVKVLKGEMTCFQCFDSRGSKKEECMYIAGAEPETKQLSFREVKEFNYEPVNNTRNTEPYNQEYQRNRINRGKRKYKKYYPEQNRHYDHHSAPSVRQTRNANTTTTKPKTDQNQNVKKDKLSLQNDPNSEEKDQNTEANNIKAKSTYNPIPTEPPSLSEDEEVEENEHSDETELAFDPVLGLSLPKYMLEKSEHEAIFDEALASG